MVVARPMQGWAGGLVSVREGVAGDATPEPVRLMLSPGEVTVAAGDEVELAALVHNAGPVPDHYLLDVAGAPAGWLAVDAPFFSLEAGGLQRVVVTVRPPAAAAPTPAAAPLRLTVRATADGNLAMPGLASAALTVRAPERVTLELAPAEIAGTEATFRATFHNPMSAPVPMALVVDDGDAGLRVRITPEEALLVPPRERVTLTVWVRPPRHAPTGTGTPRVYDLAFRGLDVRAPDDGGPSSLQRARFTYVPRLAPGDDIDPASRRPRARSLALAAGAPFALAAAAAVVVLHGPSAHGTRHATAPPAQHVLAAAPGRPSVRRSAPATTSRPSSASRGPYAPSGPPTPPTPAPAVIVLRLPAIRGFTLRHDRPGQPYRLSWGTRGALRVALDGRLVAPTGHDVLRGTLRTHTYVLVASNDVGRVAAQVRIVVPAAAPISRTYTIKSGLVKSPGSARALGPGYPRRT